MALIVTLPSVSFSDTSLPKLFRDGQVNDGSLFALDFGNPYCYAGSDGAVPTSAGLLKNLVQGGQNARISLAGAGAATFTSASKAITLSTPTAGTGDLALINTESKFNIKGSTQFNFGFIQWMKYNASQFSPHGVGQCIGGMLNTSSLGANLTPFMLNPQRRNIGVTVDTGADTFTSTAHGLQNGEWVSIEGGTAPGGLSLNTQYFVVNQTTNTFQLAATAGGAAIDLTSAGSGFTFYTSRMNMRMWTDLGLGATIATNLQMGVPFQVGIGWSVSGGTATSQLIVNGAVVDTATSGSNVTLPESGFGDLKIGRQTLAGMNTQGSMSVYRALLENLTLSGRTFSAMAAADYAANSGRFA